MPVSRASCIMPRARAMSPTALVNWAGMLRQIPVQPTRIGPVATHEINCPHCSKAFKIDEAGYADILKQVRDGDFDKQLHERLELAEREKRDAIALAEAKVTNALQGAAARKDAEIQALQAQLAAGEVARKLAVAEALGAVSKERDGLANELQNELERARKAQQAAAQLYVVRPQFFVPLITLLPNAS